jgi:hypothetical protein
MIEGWICDDSNKKLPKDCPTTKILLEAKAVVLYQE